MSTARQTESAPHPGIDADHQHPVLVPQLPRPRHWLVHQTLLMLGWDLSESWGSLGSHPRSSCMLSPAGSYLPPITVCEVWQSLVPCKAACPVMDQSSLYCPSEDLAPQDPLPSRQLWATSWAVHEKVLSFWAWLQVMWKDLIPYGRRWPLKLTGHAKDLSKKASFGLNNAAKVWLGLRGKLNYHTVIMS